MDTFVLGPVTNTQGPSPRPKIAGLVAGCERGVSRASDPPALIRMPANEKVEAEAEAATKENAAAARGHKKTEAMAERARERAASKGDAGSPVRPPLKRLSAYSAF